MSTRDHSAADAAARTSLRFLDAFRVLGGPCGGVPDDRFEFVLTPDWPTPAFSPLVLKPGANLEPQDLESLEQSFAQLARPANPGAADTPYLTVLKDGPPDRLEQIDRILWEAGWEREADPMIVNLFYGPVSGHLLPGLDAEVVPFSQGALPPAYADLLRAGYGADDTYLSFVEAAFRTAPGRTWIVLLHSAGEGVVAGGAVSVRDTWAFLSWATVLPAHRGKGYHESQVNYRRAVGAKQGAQASARCLFNLDQAARARLYRRMDRCEDMIELFICQKRSVLPSWRGGRWLWGARPGGSEQYNQDNKEFDKWKAWDEFLASKMNTGFRQSSWYTAFEVAYFEFNHFGTVLKDGETIVGGAMVLAPSFTPEKCYYYLDEGPVLRESDSEAEQEQVFCAIMEFIEQKRQADQQVVSHLCINPRWQHVPSFVKGFQESSHYYGLPRNTQLIDLSSSESAILAQMKPKGRYNIGVARRYGVSVVEDSSPQGIEDFLSIYNETFACKGIKASDSDYFHRLIPMLSASEHGSVFFAEYQGTRLATALVVYFGCTATYLYGGSRASHRKVMAPYLLQFEIMRKAKRLGCQYYDLGGVTPKSELSSELSDEGTGFSVFNREFGGQELRLVPTLEYIYDPIAYQEWKALEEE